MPSRKASRNGFDYATAPNYNTMPYYYQGGGAGGATYPTHAYPPGYAGYMNGYGSGYSHAYGSDGYHHYMRQYDPSYDAFDPEGPSVDDRWKNTYPYVPTAYRANSDGGQRNGSNKRRGDNDRNRGGTLEGGGSGSKGAASASALNGRERNAEEDAGEEYEDKTRREQWDSQWEFIFSCVGLSVGIGNVWRFPYLAYENGGGAFLLPYFILLLLIGKPMYFMEVALGQFSQLGPLSVWKMAPIGRGIGFAMVTLSLIVAIYYNVVMGYCLHYIFHSFTSELPWASCDHDWADDRCLVRTGKNISCTRPQNDCQAPTEQYWERSVLAIHRAPNMTYMEEASATNDTLVSRTYILNEFGEIGIIKWDLVVALAVSWLVVYACLAKGIKVAGKVVYFTATFPYVILIILLIRGLFLDGAAQGIKAFFIPKWDKLLDPTVWRKAAEQMFFSLSVSWGGLIMFGSYNRFRTKVHYHALAISSLDFVTSIIAGIVVFSVLGELQNKLGLDSIDDVVRQKQGLAFVAYPEAVSLLPLPQLWSVLFFFMLFTLGLDSEFALLETVLTGIYDSFPRTRRWKPVVCLIVCIACFLMSIPCVSLSGQFIFDLMDTYGGGLGVLWVAIFETAVIMWFYGVNRFADDLRFMLNTKTSYIWRICWIITPVLLVLIFIAACYYWTNPTYPVGKETLYYSDWAHGIGWFLTILVAVQIPLIAIIMVGVKAARGRPLDAFRPDPDWGPGDPDVQDEYAQHLLDKRRCKQHPYGPPGYPPASPYAYYDNYAMQYPSGYYPSYPGGAYHM